MESSYDYTIDCSVGNLVRSIHFSRIIIDALSCLAKFYRGCCTRQDFQWQRRMHEDFEIENSANNNPSFIAPLSQALQLAVPPAFLHRLFENRFGKLSPRGAGMHGGLFHLAGGNMSPQWASFRRGRPNPVATPTRNVRLSGCIYESFSPLREDLCPNLLKVGRVNLSRKSNRGRKYVKEANPGLNPTLVATR
jgi:hypothetical protein